MVNQIETTEEEITEGLLAYHMGRMRGINHQGKSAVVDLITEHRKLSERVALEYNLSHDDSSAFRQTRATKSDAKRNLSAFIEIQEDVIEQVEEFRKTLSGADFLMIKGMSWEAIEYVDEQLENLINELDALKKMDAEYSASHSSKVAASRAVAGNKGR